MLERVRNRPSPIAANLQDYEQACAEFDWGAVAADVAGVPGGGLNIAYECVDRHAATERASRTAIRWLAPDGAAVDFTYADLASLTDRFAALLASLGVVAGERVFVLCDRVPELYVAALGVLKHRAVFCPLFAAFGPEPIHSRMESGDGVMLVTTPRLYARKVAQIRDRLPALRHVLLVHEGGEIAALRPSAPAPRDLADRTPVDGTVDFAAALHDTPPAYVTLPTDPEQLALLHFTSGTTGRPKGAMHVHKAVLHHRHSARIALDLQPDDIFWCTADPGWVTGTSYGIIAPLVLGCTNIIDAQEFDPVRWYGILAEQRVTVWYTAPTAVRMLMRLGADGIGGRDLTALRFVASVGEPLNPEAVHWSLEALGLPIHDNWWQSETGGIMIANFAGCDIKPGSMGRPLPGVNAAIVRRGDDGLLEEITGSGDEGELALRPGWPSMFRGYLHQDAKYAACFEDGWYLTGDLARVDGDGYFWFVGRADDVIKSAGHLIGPFEVESALIEHPAVAEAAVIGKPDPVAGSIVKAFVSLNPGFVGDAALHRDLVKWTRKRLGPAVAPREIAFTDDLPKTRSGKIMRRLLRARELDLPEGDTSTLLRGAS